MGVINSIVEDDQNRGGHHHYCGGNAYTVLVVSLSTVLNIFHNIDGIPRYYWASSTILMVSFHSAELSNVLMVTPSPQYCPLHSTEHPPHYWWYPTTVLNPPMYWWYPLRSTEYPPQYCTGVPGVFMHLQKKNLEIKVPIHGCLWNMKNDSLKSKTF